MRSDRRAWRARATLFVAAMVGTACLSGYQAKKERLEAHFAVGQNWPEAISTLQAGPKPFGGLGGSCQTSLGIISFYKLAPTEYHVTFPTGQGEAGLVANSDDAFGPTLLKAFAASQCTTAKLVVDEYEVDLDVVAGRITRVSVRRK